MKGKEPVDDEVQVYTWMDATLRELSDLIKEASPAARDRNSQLSFAIVYPGTHLTRDTYTNTQRNVVVHPGVASQISGGR